MSEQTPDSRPEVRVRFGPRDTQTMPLQWAERILQGMCATERGRKDFGDRLAAAALADLPPVEAVRR